MGKIEEQNQLKENLSDLTNRFFSSIEAFANKQSHPHPQSKDDVLLKFMEKTITKVNYCLASLYATQQILIKKGITTREELISIIKESQGLPTTTAGREALSKMIEENEINSILSMVDISPAAESEKDSPNNKNKTS